MSRVGLKPITVPASVEVSVGTGQLSVKGPKGTLTAPLPRGINCTIEDNQVTFAREANDGPTRALHGLARALCANAIAGVTTGFERRLEIVGVGFRAAVSARKVQFSLGYSHPVDYAMPAGIDIAIEETTKVVIRGMDKQLVGQVAAQIRDLRPPDAYKGKGVRYAGEVIKLKAGKTGGK